MINRSVVRIPLVPTVFKEYFDMFFKVVRKNLSQKINRNINSCRMRVPVPSCSRSMISGQNLTGASSNCLVELPLLQTLKYVRLTFTSCSHRFRREIPELLLYHPMPWRSNWGYSSFCWPLMQKHMQTKCINNLLTHAWAYLALHARGISLCFSSRSDRSRSQVTYAVDKSWLFWSREKLEYHQPEPHTRRKMAQISNLNLWFQQKLFDTRNAIRR